MGHLFNGGNEYDGTIPLNIFLTCSGAAPLPSQKESVR
jgi:hypothetical protein